MASRNLIRHQGTGWRQPATTTDANEDALQRLLEESRELRPWADACCRRSWMNTDWRRSLETVWRR